MTTEDVTVDDTRMPLTSMDVLWGVDRAAAEKRKAASFEKLALRTQVKAMNRQKTKLELTWIGKENRPKLELSKLTVDSFETEEFLVFAAKTDDGKILDSKLCRKLMSLPGTVATMEPGDAAGTILERVRQSEAERFVRKVDERNGRFFDEEVAKLERWSDDLTLGLEREIKDLDQQIKEIRREAKAAIALTEKLAAQKKLKAVESERNRKRRELYDAQDAIDRDRDELIAKIEKQLKMEQRLRSLYAVRWKLT